MRTPGECTKPNPPHTSAPCSRFYQNNTQSATKSAKQLVHNFLTSVGRSANLILNIAPDGTGRIPPSDVARYQEMGAAIRCLFSKKLAETDPAAPLRMDPRTGEISWRLPTAVSSTNMSLVIREDQTDGQLIGNYSLSCNHAGAWTPCALGALPGVIPGTLAAGVGHKRVLMLAPAAPLLGVRLTVRSHFATAGQAPALRDMALYDWGGATARCV